MSRIAKQPLTLPKGAELTISGDAVSLKGPKGNLSMQLNSNVELVEEDGAWTVAATSGSRFAKAMAGTTRALLGNMAHGVTEGWERKLTLVGVGYRAQAQGDSLNLKVETPSQTEVILTGPDKQVVGQVAAEIRAYRPPEPYKGKGVRYADERVVRKEAKKK